MNVQDLIDAPRELLTGRTSLAAPTPDMAAERVAWVKATWDWLEYLPAWRKSVDETIARASLARAAACMAAGEELIYEVRERATGAYVGRIDLHSWDFDAPRCEIGYMADARTAGRGLLREAAGACIDLAFALGAVRIQALTDVDNHRSIRFAEALGFTHEGVLRAWERDDRGALRDQALLSIVAGDERPSLMPERA